METPTPTSAAVERFTNIRDKLCRRLDAEGPRYGIARAVDLLVLALIFHFAYFRKLVRRDDANISPGTGKLAAVIALVLWFGVGMAGRSIGFFG